MMKKNYALMAIFALVLGIRLFFAFSSPNFTGDEAYFNLMQIEHIRETGIPLYEDPLSYSGRTFVFAPLFHYILAFFSIFFPVAFVAKVLPNIFASSLVFIVYLAAKNISNNEDAALFSAIIAGFIPIFYTATINSVSQYSLLFPILFYMVYCFFNIKQNKYLYRFLALLFLASLTSSATVLLLAGFIFYMLLVKLENMRQSKEEVEIIVFSIFFFMWLQFIIFKKAFLFHGIELVWQNIPAEILSRYFTETTILKAIYLIGPLPLLYGVYSIYTHLFNIKDRKIYLLIGFAISTAALIWLKFVQPVIGLICLGIIMALLFGEFYTSSFNYLSKTRFARIKGIFIISFLLTFTLASAIPSMYSANAAMAGSVSQDEIKALTWIDKHTNNESIILTTPKDGHLVTYFGKRKSVADTNFLLVPNINQRFDDIEKMYTSFYETRALSLLTKYDADFIYFSDNTRITFNITEIPYIKEDTGSECFKTVYDEHIKIYKVRCELEIQ